ncbi:MAG: tetratricopeptide repeat protein [Selenomonadaceae bacterium]|nr:tetratricopeptide repeat protein [Selenomonadaceae bacterium]
MLKNFLIGGLILAASIFSSVSAERRQIEASGEYVFGDSEESPAVAKERARVYALKNASQQAGVFVESIVKVKNMMLTEDEIQTISSNVLQVVGEPQFKNEVTADGKGFIIRCKLVAIVDDDNISAELMKDRQSLDEAVRMNREYENRIRELTDEIEKLKRDRANAKTESEIRLINSQIQRSDKKFNATRYLDLGKNAFNAGNYSIAISYYRMAALLDPNLDRVVHTNITLAYSLNKMNYGNITEKYIPTTMGNNIIVQPSHLDHLVRAWRYVNQKEYDLAIDECNQVIKLDTDASNVSSAYCIRGYIYELKGNIEQAISDQKGALGWNPENTTARDYLNRLQSR